MEIDWDGDVLVARGTNADGRELVNAGTDDGRLVLTAADIHSLAFRDAPRMVGGVLRVVDTTGAQHRLHFRRGSRPEFLGLYQDLSAAVAAAKAELRTAEGDEQPDVVDLTDQTSAGPESSSPPGHDAVHV